MKKLLLAFVILTAACGKKEPAPAPEPVPAKTASPVDASFATPDARATWAADIDRSVEAVLRARPIEEIRLAVNTLDIEVRPLGYDVDWDIPSTTGPARDAEETESFRADAKQAEAKGDWHQAMASYAHIGDTAAMQRIFPQLRKTRDQVAVATYAPFVGNREAFEKNFAYLVDGRQFTKAKDVLESVASARRYDYLSWAAARYPALVAEAEREIPPAFYRDAALHGQPKLLADRIGREFAHWQEDLRDPNHWSEELLADIVTLARVRPSEGDVALKRYLSAPWAAVVTLVECGEGCGAKPMHGTFEAYARIRGNAELRAHYLARVERAVVESFLPPADDDKRTIAGSSEADVPLLMAFHDEARKRFPEIAEAVTRGAAAAKADDADVQALRHLVGLPVDPSILPDHLRGDVIRLAGDIPPAPEEELASNLVGALHSSRYTWKTDSATLTRLWAEAGLAVSAPRRTYATEEESDAARTEAEMVLAAILSVRANRQHFLAVDADSDTRTLLAKEFAQYPDRIPEAEAAAIQTRIDVAASFPAAVVESDCSDPAIAGALLEKRPSCAVQALVLDLHARAVMTEPVALASLGNVLVRPLQAATKNAAALEEGTAAPFPRSTAEAEALIRAELERIRVRSTDVYLRAVAHLAAKHRLDGIYEAEWLRLSADPSSRTRLAALREAYATHG